MTGELSDLWVYPLHKGQTLASNEWFEMHGHRLLASRFMAYVLKDDRRDIGFTAMILWAESYRQDPAGTLPDDDVELAQLARYGADVVAWQAVKDLALYGWRACSVETEGPSIARLGHPFIAEVAERSFRRKSGKIAGRAAGRIANMRNRVKSKLMAMGRKTLAENKVLVDALTRWLDTNDLFVTEDNLVAAMEEAGVPRVVRGPGAAG